MPPSSWSSFAAEAVVPEHLVPYVRAVSDMTPLRCGGCLAYRSGPSLVLVGHAADSDQDRLEDAVREAAALDGIATVTALGPRRPENAPAWAVSGEPDAYWGVPLPDAPEKMAYGQKLRNQLRRARRDVAIAREGWRPEHAELVERYIRTRPLGPGTRNLFRRIGDYVEAVPDAALFAARDAGGALQGFSVGDFTSLATVFYLFAFRRSESPPGTADALLAALAEEGVRRGHSRLNLGLGIHPGIVFFKRKWNATVLRSHVETTWTTAPPKAGLFGRLKTFFQKGGHDV